MKYLECNNALSLIFYVESQEGNKLCPQLELTSWEKNFLIEFSGTLNGAVKSQTQFSILDTKKLKEINNQ